MAPQAPSEKVYDTCLQSTRISRFHIWHMGSTCLLLLQQCMCPTGVLSLNTVYKPCQSASLNFHPLPWIGISWNSRVAFFVFLKFSLFNAHSVTALETHTFLTPYSVDVCIAVPAVCTLRFIHAWCNDTRAHPNPVSIFVLQLSPPCTYISKKKKSWQTDQKNVNMSSASSLTWKIRGLGSHKASQQINLDATQKNIPWIKPYCASYAQTQNKKTISSPTVSEESSITVFCNTLVGENGLCLYPSFLAVIN